MIRVSLGSIALRIVLMDGTCVVDVVQTNFQIGPSMVDAVLYLLKFRLQVVDVVMLLFKIGHGLRRVKSMDLIGLCSCTVIYLTRIGLGYTVHILPKFGLP